MPGFVIPVAIVETTMMTVQTESHDSGDGSTRSTFFLAGMIFLLLAVMVGGTYIYSRFITETTSRNPIELYASELSPTILLEMRAASTIAGPGFPNEMPDPGGLPKGKPLFISDEVAITNDDVESAGAFERDGMWSLEIHLTEAGAKKLTALSTSLVAEQPDIATTRLAILIDGKLIGAPQVSSPITGRVGEVYLGDIDQAKAVRLAKGIVGAK